jgi:Flp pilus assembly protein TadD
VLARLKRYAEAEDALQEALSLDPNDATAWSNLGICYSRTGRDDLAIQAFAKARELLGGTDPILR